MKAAAVPGSVATWAKFVQPVPLQRSTRTSVWFADPLVHVSPIELLDRAVAVKFAGALGRGGAFTTMDAVVEFDAPPLSVTVNVAVYVPGVE